MKKEVLRVWAAALCAATLCTGCGVGGTTSGTEAKTEGKGSVTLKIWVQSVNQPEYFQWVKQAFEAENKGIKLKIEPQAQNTLGDALDVSLGSSNAPDIAATWGGLVAAKLYKSGHVLELSDVITADIEASFVEAATYNKMDGGGQYVSLPLAGFISPVIYYNKAEFEKLGIEAPKTYDELVSVSSVIRDASKQPLIAGFSTWHLPHFMQAIHARTMSPEDFKRLIGTPTDINPYTLPGFKEGFDLLEQYNRDGIFADNITGYDANMAQMEFVAQNALMLTAPSLDLMTLNEAANFELGAFLLPPASANGPLASGVYSDVLVINAKSEHVDECKKLLSFLITPEAQSKLLEYELLPVLKDVDISSANTILSDVVEMVNEKGVSGFYQSYSAPGTDIQILNAGSTLLTGGCDAAAAAKILEDYYKANILEK